MSTRRVFRTPLMCRICGDTARGLNFDVITCMSCKAFFRRNALRPTGSLQCAYDGDCHINRESRMRCSACRLRKCFIYGMKAQLIRSCPPSPMEVTTTTALTNSSIFTRQWPCQLPLPQPIGLLQHNHSQMSSEQWTLISSIVHAYDTQHMSTLIQTHLKEQSALPMKLRSKPLPAMQYIADTAHSLVLFIQRSPHFQTLSLDTRRRLIRNNIYLTNCVNRLLINREMDLLNNSDLMLSFHSLYGSDLFKRCASLLQRTELNGILFKVILFVMIFSSNCSIVTEDVPLDIDIIFELKHVLDLQDLYVTLLWKYLVYQYGYTEAVLRYASLIKTILDFLQIIETMVHSELYQQMLKKIIIESQNLLIND